MKINCPHCDKANRRLTGKISMPCIRCGKEFNLPPSSEPPGGSVVMTPWIFFVYLLMITGLFAFLMSLVLGAKLALISFFNISHAGIIDSLEVATIVVVVIVCILYAVSMIAASRQFIDRQ
jgi:hypothetical protein